MKRNLNLSPRSTVFMIREKCTWFQLILYLIIIPSRRIGGIMILNDFLNDYIIVMAHHESCELRLCALLYSSVRYFLYFVWLLHSSAAWTLSGLSLLGSVQQNTVWISIMRQPGSYRIIIDYTYWLYSPPRRDCMESNMVRTSYSALHLSFNMSKHILPTGSTLGWKQGVTKRTIGALYG